MIKGKFKRDPQTVVAKLRKLTSSVEEITYAQLVELGTDIHADVVQSLHAHQTKQPAEIRYNPKRKHSPSKPGSPPNSDLGTLAQSYRIDLDPQTNTVSVGSNLKYASYLELGTKHVAARPHLFPALKRQSALFRKRYLRDMMKKVGSKS